LRADFDISFLSISYSFLQAQDIFVHIAQVKQNSAEIAKELCQKLYPPTNKINIIQTFLAAHVTVRC
jgi:hypothetical protein